MRRDLKNQKAGAGFDESSNKRAALTSLPGISRWNRLGSFFVKWHDLREMRAVLSRVAAVKRCTNGPAPEHCVYERIPAGRPVERKNERQNENTTVITLIFFLLAGFVISAICELERNAIQLALGSFYPTLLLSGTFVAFILGINQASGGLNISAFFTYNDGKSKSRSFTTLV